MMAVKRGTGSDRRAGRRGTAPGVLMALLAIGCDSAPPAPLSYSQQVDALFAELAEGVQPGAAVMVIQDGEIVHRAGYGYANVEDRRLIDADTAFRLASVSKQFTAMAVMLLAEDGRLAYDDPVSRHLPSLESFPGVTIRHLMTHTGGLPEYYDVIDTSGGMPTNADALALLSTLGGTVFVPGERYEYSNPGYDMLAPLVASVAGRDFAAFMRERIFSPLSMNGTLVHDHTRPEVPRRATGYRPDEHGSSYLLDDDDPLNGIVGSGGVYSTLNDLYRWDQALYGDALVSRATLEEAFTPALLNDGTPSDYGFGWRIEEHEGHRRVRHGGSWVGFRTHIARCPDERFTVIILSNRADLDPEAYVNRITAIWHGGPEA
ncbi:MAG TPA: serine hydrolase domain-containing protein [Woeseiaceae bacterium]|nr:serine hydrolase domain-containing protein [Woeseiaceae bacterium]